MNSNKTIILANGAFPESDTLLSILDTADKIICCDGAVNKLVNSGREPSIIIGDLDSAKESIKQKFADRLIHIKDQNTNDLTKAVNWCLSQGINKVIIMGATGEREDHTIANIALLSKYEQEINIKIMTDNGVFIPISETTTFETFIGQQISIFSQNPEVALSSEGLKYPLQNLKLSSWWMGTLNEATADKITISFEEKARIIVYLLKK